MGNIRCARCDVLSERWCTDGREEHKLALIAACGAMEIDQRQPGLREHHGTIRQNGGLFEMFSPA